MSTGEGHLYKELGPIPNVAYIVEISLHMPKSRMTAHQDSTHIWPPTFSLFIITARCDTICYTFFF